MAFKNQKKNKAHVAKLRKDPNNWRAVKREKKRRSKPSPIEGMTIEKFEQMINRL